MNKRWIAAPVVIAAPLVLAVCLNAAVKPSQTIALSGATEVMSAFAAPAGVTVSSVMPTWATVRFVLPAADRAAVSEEVAVYSVTNGSATAVSSGTVAGTGVTVTGLRPSTSYIVGVSVNAAQGQAASPRTMSAEFVTAAVATSAPAGSPAADTATAAAAAPTPNPTAPPTLAPAPAPSSPAAFSFPAPGAPGFPTAAATPAAGLGVSTPAVALATPVTWPSSAAATATPAPATSASAASSAAAAPYAPALSAYNVLAQSYSATDIAGGGWAQDANVTNEGGGTCPVANTSYSPALDAVVMTTGGSPATGGTADCAHIRSQYTVPTSGDVVEAKIWLPSLSSAATVNGTTYPAGALLDWASMWTDGADSTNGPERWPADTEVDAVETQYGANYVSVHYGSVASASASTGVWTTAPQGWGPAGTSHAAPNAGAANVQPGWNVVDIEFTAGDANIYFNGALFVTIPGSVLSHDPAYLDFGISGPNGNDPNNPTWPAGPATEDVQYVKVFS